MSRHFGVVGCGSMGRRRMRHALELGDGMVIAWDIREDRRREVRAQLSVATAQSEADFFSGPLDAVFISVPPSEHEHYIYAAIERKIPFMVEQPISHSLENLDRIFKGVENAGITCHVSCNQRYAPRVLALSKALSESGVGRVLTGIVELGEWLPNWHPYEPYQDYYPSWKRMGGGIDAICDLDWLRFLFGEVRESRSLCSRKSTLEIDTYDVQQFLLDFEDGPQLALHCDMLQQPFSRLSRFVCENGVVLHNHPDQFVKAFVADRSEWIEYPFPTDFLRFVAMQGKPSHQFAEPMYYADSAVFIDRLTRADRDLSSLKNGMDNLRLVVPLIYPEAPK
jgi:predicted dehydrogenase